MFSDWLRSNLPKSWETLNCAVKKVRKRLGGAREREENRQHIQKEERKAVDALSQLKESLETMDDMNTKIVDNKSKLAKELKEQQGNWESFQHRWRKEDMEWNRGEKRRKERKQALERHNLRESQFVKEFLREKQLPDNLSDQEVECYLRKDILEEGITRSKQMRSRRHQVQKHHKELQSLLHEVKQWKELVEERVTQVYVNIVRSLEDLGLQPKNLRALQRQLTELKNTLKECEKAMEHCTQTLRDGEIDLKDCENQLREFTESFGEVVEGMEKVFKGLENRVVQMEQYIARPVLAAGGALIGTFFLPIVGTVIGGAVGWAAGKVIDAGAGDARNDRERLMFEMETNRRTLRNCKETANSAKREHEELMNILNYKVRRITPMWRLKPWKMQ